MARRKKREPTLAEAVAAGDPAALETDRQLRELIGQHPDEMATLMELVLRAHGQGGEAGVDRVIGALGEARVQVARARFRAVPGGARRKRAR